MAARSTDEAVNPPSKLLSPITVLPGVGPNRAQQLARIGIHHVVDAIFCFPRSYQDLTQVKRIAELEENQEASVEAVIEEMDLRGTGPGKSMLGILFSDGSGALRGVWFNQTYLVDRFRRGQRVLVSGRPRMRSMQWEMTHPRVQSLEEDDDHDLHKMLPIYPLTENLKQRQVRAIVRQAVMEAVDDLEEVLPESFRLQHQLAPLVEAVQGIHWPADAEQLAIAKRRFVFQELLVMQLALAMKRQQASTSHGAVALELSAKLDARIRNLLPFTLTPNQEACVQEICQDLQRTVPMNRLLQGDVGSGKTVVAMYAMLVSVAQGHQAAMMVPTEVLARQHFERLSQMLAHGRVRTAIWTGSLSAREREETQRAVEAGEIDLLIGTQALVHGQINFPRLAVVVIDEQHKFGVRQRAQLRASGIDPHYLVMTATPIPRTIAMTCYGDLDVSLLEGFPGGRQEVHTYLVEEAHRERWWEFFRKQLGEGRQGYVITPLVSAKGREDLVGVQESFEALANGELEAFRIGLIHGQMSAEEKHATMQAFYERDLQALVATSVVEVGIDVPNATVMTIENAERFGLAQLHQLRGRVGRGAFPGYVAAFSEATSEDALKRLQAFSETRDGFRLAEIDLETRGPGEFFGTRQHGMPPFKLARLPEDEPLLREARQAAQQLINDDRQLWSPQWSDIRKRLLKRYGEALQLGDVG